MLGLSHPDIEAGLLISGISRSTGLLVRIVNSQLVEGDLRKGNRVRNCTQNT